MPELPEMETYRQRLTERVVGRQIDDVRVDRPRRVNLPPSVMANRLRGARISAVLRRGKSLALILNDAGQEIEALYLHLMLGGRLSFESTDPGGAVSLIFGDRALTAHVGLGRLEACSRQELDSRWSRLGVEPLSSAYSPDIWHQAYHNSRRPIKACLLDQQVVAGIGNVYSDEILHSIEVHPATPATDLVFAQWQALGRAVPHILTKAVQYGGVGPPIDDQDTRSGGFRPFLAVHYQTDKPCGAHGTVLRGTVAGRTSYWCSSTPRTAPSPNRRCENLAEKMGHP